MAARGWVFLIIGMGVPALGMAIGSCRSESAQTPAIGGLCLQAGFSAWLTGSGVCRIHFYNSSNEGVWINTYPPGYRLMDLNDPREDFDFPTRKLDSEADWIRVGAHAIYDFEKPVQTSAGRIRLSPAHKYRLTLYRPTDNPPGLSVYQRRNVVRPNGTVPVFGAM